MGTPPSPALARPGPAPAPLRSSWRFPRDSVVGSSHRFSAGPAEIADILRYLAVLAGPVPSCHLHLRSVPPGSRVRKIILCQRELGITCPKISLSSSKCPPAQWEQGVSGPPVPSAGCPQIHGELGPMSSGQPMPGAGRRGGWGNVRSQCHGEKCGDRWSFVPVFCFQLGLQNVGISYQNGCINSVRFQG